MTDATPVSQTGSVIEDVKKLSKEELLERIAKQTTEILDLRRQKEEGIRREKDRGQSELERFKNATAMHRQDLESQNSALVKSVARLQGLLDHQGETVVELRTRLSMMMSPPPVIITQPYPAVPPSQGPFQIPPGTGTPIPPDTIIVTHARGEAR